LLQPLWKAERPIPFQALKMTKSLVLLLLLGLVSPLRADYKIQSGDLLDITVWNEDRLTKQSRVLPDGTISFPLVGVLKVSEQSPAQVEALLKQQLSNLLSDPVVNIEVREASGNAVYVIGKVNAPGRFILNKPTDVLQILSMAGGFGTYADTEAVRILRRDASGKTQVFEFDYEKLIRGKDLDKNIVLQASDTIIVP